MVLGYIQGKFPPNSNCCFWQRDVSIWKYNSDLDDDDDECSIFNGEDLLMLRFSNTKSSMLHKLVHVGKADWIVFNDTTENNSSRWKCGAEVEVRLFTGMVLLSNKIHPTIG